LSARHGSLIRLSSDKPLAQLAVRLCDLRPDGTSALITMGVLNLTHRNSSEAPELLTPGEAFETTVTARSDRLPDSRRTSLADRGFDQLLAVHLAIARTRNRKLEAGSLDLPFRTMLADRDECSFEKPVGAEPWRHENLRPSAIGADQRDRSGDRRGATSIFNDAGENRDLRMA
jgi:hypothetical protein